MAQDSNLLNDFVVGQRNPLLVELSITPLVDQLPNTLEVGVPTKRYFSKLVKMEHLIL
jgi:hypothetical protein